MPKAQVHANLLWMKFFSALDRAMFAILCILLFTVQFHFFVLYANLLLCMLFNCVSYKLLNLVYLWDAEFVYLFYLGYSMWVLVGKRKEIAMQIE